MINRQSNPRPAAAVDLALRAALPSFLDEDRLAAGGAGRLHHIFEAACDSAPDAVAVECGSQAVSYKALDERANRLAHRLRALGVTSGARVGLLLERSLETYVSLLAVLKAGGVFVPVDPSAPSDRVAFIAQDAELRLIVTTHELRAALGEGVGTALLELDTDAVDPATLPASRLAAGGGEDASCYVIYTSGSTGRPKGVDVAHSSICNYLSSAVRSVYRFEQEDRVYQGITTAFDFSVEEIWVTWAAGATLIAGPIDDRRLGPGLADFLVEQRITVLGGVPTLVASLSRDVPTLRLLIVGGEVCPPELVKRWSRPGRRILNTYGPTETTITATWKELEPDGRVTIGRPLPTYRVHILDDDLRPVAAGETGEICIGGAGVARGYVGRPELTAERFVHDPYSDEPGARLYRSGDLGRYTDGDEIEFRGRADSQVKLRGFRIDLGEIEAVILEDPDVRVAVVDLHNSAGVGPELAAYVSGDDHGDGARLVECLAARMRQRLPAYMLPSFIDLLSSIPTLPSGKADRSRLPPPVSRLGSSKIPFVVPSSPLEVQISELWAEVLGHDRISAVADFFLDLGGHSLAAATTVSALRERTAHRDATIGDIYGHTTVRELAAALEARQMEEAEHPRVAPRLVPRTASGRAVAACGLAQLLLLYLVIAVVAAPTAWLLALHHGKPSEGLLWACVALVPCTFIAFSVVVPALGGRLLMAGVQPGRYRLWGSTYTRWWLTRKLLALAPIGLMSGSPLLPPYLRLLGARVGRRCVIATPNIALPRFTALGDDVSIGAGALLQPFAVEAGWLTLEAIEVGDGAFVGANAVVLGGARLGRRAGLADQSLAAAGARIPDEDWWAGSPPVRRARPDAVITAARATPPPPARWPRALLAAFGAGFLALALLPWVAVAGPVVLIIWSVESGGVWLGLASTLLAAPLFVLSVCLPVCAGVRLASRPIGDGVFPLRSGLGVCKWLVDRLLELSLSLTGPVYATLYAAPWMRLLGARVGARAEVSTLAHVDPVLLTLGEESFAADLSTVGAATFVDGRVVLARTEVGARSFVGNAALVRAGTTLERGSLVGVHTVAPDTVAEGTSWLGSPALFLPRRQDSAEMPERLTFRPSRGRVAARLAIEYLRITLPATLVGAATLLAALGELYAAEHVGFAPLWALTPAVAAGAGLLVTLAAALLKWAIVGRYRPRVEPLWSTFVRRNELVTALYENAAVPALIGMLTGTPLMLPALRLFGASVGRRVWLDTTFTTEFDLVRIGDDAAVGGLSSLQTHLFEDRVMKMSYIDIGRGSTIGARTVVLYDSRIGDRAALDALSLAMKGESLPAATRWRGIPAAAA